MEYDFMKRGYLLPEGCKDLIDVLKLKQKFAPDQLVRLPEQHGQLPKGHGMMIKPRKQTAALTPVKGEVLIPDQVSVAQLAALLSQKPLVIIADLMQLGVFASVWQLLGFETISRIARKYGYIARKAV
ncbi:MAG TPA: translation initiation factor IF-2 N-terminal domain-containing protein [Candidatus Acidoferrum sp.]|jgi:hypothetical protein|nr:translation initiation factor IF-2 N-terminal domain-containing protein [Candidatus Acidoferrum sp.]